MDSFIYALVMVPALRELLPRSGIPSDQPNVGFYGGLLFALFLTGWGCSLVWGRCFCWAERRQHSSVSFAPEWPNPGAGRNESRRWVAGGRCIAPFWTSSRKNIGGALC